ncbi:hypothetical protein O3M35_002694 [Rhynocoris fuscipes]|uniref:N-acetyltransferase domain-containing protein n=1 Tax=Rhynocoris fuscipes TaxID=488301 RepID=A0AAW1CSZ1_9HEMI
MEDLQVYPVHKCCRKEIVACCDLINSEWPRSKMARLQSLCNSSDKFPTSLVLMLNGTDVVGHLKLTELRVGGGDIMVESVVIRKDHRGKGWGKVIMEYAEEYVRSKGKKMLYLSTRGQEGFYKKLGYEICQPILYFGFSDITPQPVEKLEISSTKKDVINCPNAPPPPPLPTNKKPASQPTLISQKPAKTYMCKHFPHSFVQSLL